MASDPISTAARDAFLASAPPRVVSQEIYQKVTPWRDTLVGLLAGAFFLLIGSVLSWSFVPRHALQQWRLNREATEQVMGKILTMEDTSAEENGAQIWKYEFEFRPQRGPGWKGEAYTTGKRWDEGQPVKVRYLSAEPSVAAPVGARLDEFSPWVAFVLIFPLVGLVCMAAIIFGRLSKRKLLREGLIGPAVVDAVEKSNFQSNGRNSYNLRMTLRADGVQIQKRSIDTAEISAAEEKLKSGEPLTLLYDRKKPQRFLIIESWIPSAARAEAQRYLRENSLLPARPVFSLRSVSATDEFLRMATPRRIPREIAKRAVPGSGMLPVQIFGAFFLSAGLFFSSMALPLHLPKQWLLDIAPSKTVAGEIVSVEDGKMQINHTKIIMHRFTYQVEGRGVREGIAYRPASDWVVGTAVKVRYVAALPKVAVPEGARMGAGTAAMLVVLIFPLIGAGALFGPMAFRFRKLQVLRNGRVSTATITSVDTTSVTVNDQSQYLIHLTRAGDGAQMTRRTYFKGEIALAMRKWQDGEPVKILYLPDKPNRVMLPESWAE